MDKQQPANTRPPALDFWLTLMIGIGLIIVLICTFFIHLFMHLVTQGLGVKLTHGEAWEFGAVAWSCFFLFYYYARMPLTGNQNLDKLIAAIIFIGIATPSVFAIRYLINHEHWYHFLCVCCIGAMFSVLDRIIGKFHKVLETRCRFRESFWVGDLPLLVGFGVLFLYILSDVGDIETPAVFLAGAISFQLLTSNVLFVLSQAGVIRRIWEPLHAAQAKGLLSIELQ